MQKRVDCIRKKGNWANIANPHRLDSVQSNPELLIERAITENSPKMRGLIEYIRACDNYDYRRYGKLYKHVIFSDVDAQYGSKIIASCMASTGIYFPAFDKKLSLRSDEDLKETSYYNFLLLSSTNVYGKNIRDNKEKQITWINKFNSRPDNVYGKNARFIILDRKFREGISLFDVKYIHIFEEPLTKTERTQVIGRALRMCGHQGLPFDNGWKLHIVTYETRLPSAVFGILGRETSNNNTKEPKNDAYETIGDYIKNFHTSDDSHAILEKWTRKASIEGAHKALKIRGGGNINSRALRPKITQLMKVHAKSKKPVPPKNIIAKRLGDANAILSAFGLYIPSAKREKSSMSNSRSNFESAKTQSILFHSTQSEFSEYFDASSDLNIIDEHYPPRIMTNEELIQFMSDEFGPPLKNDAKLTNRCIENGNIQIKPHIYQRNVASFFGPTSAYKGLMLWHSVGSGKTLSSFLIANSFYEAGYRIMYVVRSSLIPNILSEANKYKMSHAIKQTNVMGYVSFSNSLVSGVRHDKLMRDTKKILALSNNKKTGGNASDTRSRKTYKATTLDPLYRTLLIIDEAHNMYEQQLLQPMERPQMDIIEKAIHASYSISGNDSVKVLLMSATPYAEDISTPFKLLNLLRSQRFLPTTQQDIDQRYGSFDSKHYDKFADDVAGYISYVNKEDDYSMFAKRLVHKRLVFDASDNQVREILKCKNK